MQAKGNHQQPEGQKRWARDPHPASALLPASILAATFIAYIPALFLGFVLDDHVLIVANDSIRSWRYFPGYFTSHIWSFRYPHLLSNAYRPLYLVWLRLNEMTFDGHAWGWHLSLVAAHVAVTWLVYRLCLGLVADRWSAAGAALVFGLHPVHVETIAEAAWADQPLSTFFMLAALLAFCRSRQEGHRAGWLAASLGFTAAGLLSKESGLMMPILVSGYVLIYGGGPGGMEVGPVEGHTGVLARLRAAFLAAIPYWAVVLLYLPVRVGALKGFTHIVTPIPLRQEVLTLPYVLLFYLRLLLWPVGLSCYYDTPYISRLGWFDFILPGAILALVAAALAFWCLRTWRVSPPRARAIAFSAIFMVLTLLPVLNFRLLPEGEIAHDRYIYLPSVGFVMLVAMGMGALGRMRYLGLGQEKRTKNEIGNDAGLEAPALPGGADTQPAGAQFGLTRLGWILAVALFAVMGFATARQTLFWADDLTLNYRAHQIAPSNVSATTSLAAAVAGRGMEGTAMALYREALEVQPRFWRANVNLGYLEYARADYPEAARYFAIACASDPTDGDQFLYLGMALLRMGRLDEAEKAVRAGMLVRPQGKAYHLGLGMVLRAEGKLTEARQEIAAEIAADPQNAQARGLLDQVTLQIEAESAKSAGDGDSRNAGINLK